MSFLFRIQPDIFGFEREVVLGVDEIESLVRFVFCFCRFSDKVVAVVVVVVVA